MSGRKLFLQYYQLARDENRTFLLENEAAQVCESYGLPLPPSGYAEDKEQAVSIAEELGYPVVLKVVLGWNMNQVGSIILIFKPTSPCTEDF